MNVATQMDLQGAKVGLPAPSFSLRDQNANLVELRQILEKGPALIVFYPGDFTLVCTKQLCNYRDNWEQFKAHGVQIIGISDNSPEEHAKFAKQYDFPFQLLSDPKKKTAREWGCASFLMLGGISRAVFVVGADRMVLHRYVEPTILTRRKADELVIVLENLKKEGLLSSAKSI